MHPGYGGEVGHRTAMITSCVHQGVARGRGPVQEGRGLVADGWRGGGEQVEEYNFNHKREVEDKEPPQKIDRIDFGVHSGEEMVRMSVMECNQDNMYLHVPTAPGQPTVREAARCGPLDRRLGTTDKSLMCATCGEPLQTCSGHFGFLRLTLPVFHQGYFKAIIAVLSCICKTCSRILLVPEEAASALAFMRRVQVYLLGNYPIRITPIW
ncbi:hypothetical protein T484DRAFT_1764938 [Baffinella frigidus]|nr:hypothetical protein T484DRAFT_1764938 [Cryptophyta sp. CCMP2293]